MFCSILHKKLILSEINLLCVLSSQRTKQFHLELKINEQYSQIYVSSFLFLLINFKEKHSVIDDIIFLNFILQKRITVYKRLLLDESEELK